MGSKEQSDAYWKQKLSKEEYEALRLGILEAPEKGAYVHTNAGGVYECRGCKSRLFDSKDKIDDGSGYATFKMALDESMEQVTLVREYSMHGPETTKAVCAECGGKLGIAVEDATKSVDDLEESTHARFLHISSHAIRLRKRLSPRNYPVGFIVVLALLLGVGYMAWSWGGTYLSVARHENVDTSIHLWVGDTELYATTLHMEKLDHEAQSIVFGKEAFFLILGKKENSAQLRLSNQPVDVLWLDRTYKVIRAEHKDALTSNQTLIPPENAVFGLVTRAGELPNSVFKEGYEILVVDKKALF